MTAELPSKAKLKLFRLQSLATDAAGLAAATTTRIMHLQESLGFAENKDADIANIEHELARLRGVLSQLQSKASNRAQVISQLTAWQGGLTGNVTISDASTPAPKLKPGEGCRTAVERLRKDIDLHSSEVRRLKYAALLKNDQKTRATAWVQNLAASVVPQITATHASGFKIDFDSVASFGGKPAPLAYLAWADPNTLIQRLHKIIDDAPCRLSMTRREQEQRLAESAAALLHAERQEEAFIEMAADEGNEIERRPQADPCAVLGVAVVRRAAVIRR